MKTIQEKTCLNIKPLLLLLILGIMLALSACGNQTVSTKQLKEDLYNSDSFMAFRNMQMEITDFDIIKRQTSKEDKVDTVWVSIHAANENAEGDMRFKLIYNLYNDGWMFEYAVDDDTDLWSFIPLRGMTDEEINAYIPNIPGSIVNEIDLARGVQNVTYTYDEHHAYCTITHKKQYQFYFDSYYTGQWMYGRVIDAGSYEKWDINGTWYAEGLGKIKEGYFTIENFASIGEIVDLCIFDDDPRYFSIDGQWEYLVIDLRNDGYEWKYKTGPFSVGLASNDEYRYQIRLGQEYGTLYVLSISYDKIELWGQELVRINASE